MNSGGGNPCSRTQSLCGSESWFRLTISAMSYVQFRYKILRCNIPAVSGLLYTPIFVNPTILGFLPGYYNSAYGVTATLAPSKSWYLSLGTYDGNGARGVQTGLETLPTFNGYRFQIGEIGACLAARFSGPPRLVRGRGLGPDRTAHPERVPNGIYYAGRGPGRLHVRIATLVEGPRGRRRLRLHSVRRKQLADDPVRKPLFRVGAYRVWPHPGQAGQFARRGTRVVGTEPEPLVPRRRGALPSVLSDPGEERILSGTSLDAIELPAKGALRQPALAFTLQSTILF